MEALISNYTENDIHHPKVAKVKFSARWVVKRSNAIVVSWPNRIGINNRILNLLNSFKKLEDNWDLDDAVAPLMPTIRKAKFLTTFFQSIGQKIYHTAPGPNGEIMLDLRSEDNKKSIELIIYPDKIITVFIPENGLPNQEIFTTNKTEEYINWLNRR